MEVERMPETIHDVPTPCFLVDLDIAKKNAQAMIDQCKSLGVQLRPHMKTHKCLEFGELMTGGSKRCITVSTLAEAEFFADGGFDDILFGALFTRDKIPRLEKLAARLDSFHVFIDSDCMREALESKPPAKGRWSVYLKVDCGGSRAGVLWDDQAALELAKRAAASDHMDFRGLYTHEGHTYEARGRQEVGAITTEATERMLNLANRLREAGIPCRNVGMGSTPSASLPSDTMREITELHPGNYIFYDVMQCTIGACAMHQVAAKVATRVIGQYSHRGQVLVDAGWTAVSLDGKGALSGGDSYCTFQDHPLLKLSAMTQEAGFVSWIGKKDRSDKYPVGKMLFLYPWHSCATAAMHRQYYIHSGDKIVAVWKPCSGW